MNKALKIIFWMCFSFLICSGFRSFPGNNRWDVSSSSTANSKIFVSYTDGSETVTNDLTGDDALAGSGSVTVDQLMSSIFDDYNNIDASYLTLVSTSDSDYAARGTNRTIVITFGDASGVSSGEAKQTVEDGVVVGCKVNLESSLLDSAKSFTATVTHELGHCLGLDHPQELTQSIMSYFSDSDISRLQIDDKMGIIYHFPTDPDNVSETATLGLSCSRKE